MSLPNNSVLQESSLLEVLRARTDSIHKEIESSPVMTRLLEDTVELSDYSIFLHSLDRAYAGIEAELRLNRSLSEVVQDLSRREKQSALQQDLLHLQSCGLSPSLPALPPFEYLSTLSSSLPHALGVMYVLEGSTLGGKVILKSLRNKFSAGRSLPEAYLSSYGDDTGTMWKSFLSVLNKTALDGKERNAAADAALALFLRVKRVVGAFP